MTTWGAGSREKKLRPAGARVIQLSRGLATGRGDAACAKFPVIQLGCCSCEFGVELSFQYLQNSRVKTGEIPTSQKRDEGHPTAVGYI